MKGDVVRIAQLLVVLVGGFVTSWTDLRSGLIKNVHVATVALIGGPLGLWWAAQSDMVAWWFSGIVFTVTVALIFWRHGWLPAGDAKLLIATGLAVPVWWYPSFAPAVFPFSLIMACALMILAVPVVFAAGWSHLEPARIKECVLGVFDGGGVWTVVVSSWSFLAVWRAWTMLSAVHQGVVAAVIGALVIVSVSMMGQKWWSSLRMGNLLGVSLILAFAALCMWLGTSLQALFLTAVGALMLVAIVAVVRDRVAASSMTLMEAASIAIGSVVVGSDDPEGVTLQSRQRLAGASKWVMVWQEVRFAHAVFAAVLLVGFFKVVQVHGWGSWMILNSWIGEWYG